MEQGVIERRMRIVLHDDMEQPIERLLRDVKAKGFVEPQALRIHSEQAEGRREHDDPGHQPPFGMYARGSPEVGDDGDGRRDTATN